MQGPRQLYKPCPLPTMTLTKLQLLKLGPCLLHKHSPHPTLVCDLVCPNYDTLPAAQVVLPALTLTSKTAPPLARPPQKKAGVGRPKAEFWEKPTTGCRRGSNFYLGSYVT